MRSWSFRNRASCRARRRPPFWLEALEDRLAPATLDQVYDARSDWNLHGDFGSINTNQQRAQTFTVGLAGELSRIDVLVHRFAISGDVGDLNLEIRPTDASGKPLSGPTDFLLHTQMPATAVPKGGSPDFVTFDF